MRKCNQKQCAFLIVGQGCRKCGDCSALPFQVADDCIRCYECENVPNSCRWDDEGLPTEEATEEEKEKKKIIKVNAK